MEITRNASTLRLSKPPTCQPDRVRTAAGTFARVARRRLARAFDRAGLDVKAIAIGAIFVAFATIGQAWAAEQRIVRAGTPEATAGPAANFTGRVTVRALASPVPPGQAGAGLVTFEAGARSNWHTHPAGQILYVTEGCGWVQAEGGPVSRICQGDTVQAPPGTRHWHGGTATSGMSHVAVTEAAGGRNVEWQEPVTAADYQGP